VSGVSLDQWEAKGWDEKSATSSREDLEVTEAFRAYALRQAALRRAMSEQCKSSWNDTLALVRRLKSCDGNSEEIVEHCSGHQRRGPPDGDVGDDDDVVW
jgi:hypothetical protein